MLHYRVPGAAHSSPAVGASKGGLAALDYPGRMTAAVDCASAAPLQRAGPAFLALSSRPCAFVNAALANVTPVTEQRLAC